MVSTDPFAAPPKIKPVPPGAAITNDGLVVERGWAELTKVEASGLAFDLTACDELELSGSSFVNVELGRAETTEITVADCRFENCDLSARRFSSVRRSTFTNCKLDGTDFSTGSLVDVEFDNCSLRLTNMRMAELSRIAFRECQVDGLDLFDATIADIDFAGSKINELGADRISAERVDLRSAAAISFATITRLDGFRITDAQLPLLMHALAGSVGLSVDQG